MPPTNPPIFLSTPSSQRATLFDQSLKKMTQDFYPRPLRRGRPVKIKQNIQNQLFLSTPSSQRATDSNGGAGRGRFISIHALFAEGDAAVLVLPLNNVNFYPRPLRRGRLTASASENASVLFLSTPSSQRATDSVSACIADRRISIHALFAEGDR